MGINMRLFILTGTLLFVQLSQQAAVLEAAEDVSELAFPDGEVEEPSPREDDDSGSGDEYGSGDYEYYAEPYDYPYYWCKCSFDEYEEYDGVEYALETEFAGQEAARSLDRKKKKHHAGRSLDRKRKKKKRHHSG